jgi:hypothetical protein
MGEGRSWGKGVGERIWCKYCVHLYVSGKMIPVQTVLNRRRKDKGKR